MSVLRGRGGAGQRRSARFPRPRTSREEAPTSRATSCAAISGKTIEVQNCDAEGRLILADALSYVARVHKPAAIVDMATLTGAVVIALGHYGAALLANDDALGGADRGVARRARASVSGASRSGRRSAIT